jgi:nucleotide-binding universal stress UspA family protein
MIRSILIGLDGSPYSETAVALGLQWAQQTGAELVGLAVVDEPGICRPEPTGIGGSAYKHNRDQVVLERARLRARELLDEFSRRSAEANVAHKSLERTGVPSEQILAEAEDFDLTLLGLQTFFQFQAPPTGDGTLERVLRHCPRPVVAVPRNLPNGRSVVVAYNGSPPAVRALEAFQAAGLDKSREVFVVSVADDEALAARRAEEGAQFLRCFQFAAEALPVHSSGPPAERLLEQVEERAAYMLVMGAYGRSRLFELFSASITNTVLKCCNVLLFLHH